MSAAHFRAVPLSVLLVAGFPTSSWAGDLGFSDPAAVSPPPPGSIGQADRAPDLDARAGFSNPPPGFGDVGFYWWLGDPLTRERLQWQLDRMAGMGMSGLQINYAHDDKGGRTYGLTFPSEPPLFTEDWWRLQQWFVQAAKEKGMAVSLSDYTLGTAGQGSYIDEVLAKNPDLRGATLHHAVRREQGGKSVTWQVPEGIVSVTAHRANGNAVVPGTAVNLRPHLRGRDLTWNAPAGDWLLVAVAAQTHPLSIDPMDPRIGPKIIEVFFQRFEDRNPGEAGKGLNFFFSDELQFGVAGKLWNANFAGEFKRRKGYDLLPELAALFTDIGPRTPKIRLDYADVMVALQEEGFFKPVFDWHQRRGMIYGCDHGGRGRRVDEFGDYFRTQRWNQGPGADQPRLGKDLIKAKVAASIAHLYERPRVWLEGYYSSGWGTSSAQVADATFANYAMGFNLLTLHGLYYSTHGGWWEWAPPCNHFHMPYWPHMKGFMDCVRRLSYVMSQGRHCCDVAVMYPVAPVEAGMGGAESVNTSFDTARALYGGGIDFDFMDFESLARARVRDGRLTVSGESYRALVLPAMKAVRFSTVRQAVEFQRAGGLVIVVGAVPEASERAGREDPELDRLVAELTTRVATPEQARELVNRAFTRDYAGPGSVQHRRLGERDFYLVYGGPQDAECAFRATGRPELWDPWTGTARPLPVLAQTAETTRLKLPLTEKEPQLIVFGPGRPESPAATGGGEEVAAVEGDWEFELQPVLDNRFGDYHWPPTPALIGAEARQLEHSATGPDGPWKPATCGFGPKLWKLGPLPDGCDESLLVGLKAVDPKVPVTIAGKPYFWQPYEFSWRWGKEGDPGHQGYHGLKGNVTDDFICLGAPRPGKNETLYGPEPGGNRYYLWTSVPAEAAITAHPRSGGLKPAACWINHRPADRKTALHAGANPVLLRYDGPGRGHFVLDRRPPPAAPADTVAFSAAACWIWYPQETANGDRWFRRTFMLDKPAADAVLRITCDNGYAVTINGRDIGSGNEWTTVREYAVAGALRAGSNDIVVRASNTGASAGLIAELRSGATVIATDATWRASRQADGASVAAESLGSFRDSLWFKHPNGPPQIVSAAVRPPKFEQKPLAMTWWNNPAILPFDPTPQLATPVGHYRFTAPPGLRAIHFQADGRVRAWAGDRELRADGTGRLVIDPPSPDPVPVRLTVDQNRGAYGGAAFPEYLRLECGPGRFKPGDWSQLDGLRSYSGGAWYRKQVTLPDAKRVILDLGEVVSTAEVRINGRSAGVRVSPPWTFDLTGLATPGENRLEVLVYNTLGNHYTSIPTAYRGGTVAGLLGPVRLRVAKP